VNIFVQKGGIVNIKIKTKWSKPNERWLVHMWHPLHGKWYQIWDMQNSPFNCLTVNWISGYSLDKNIEQVFNVEITKENHANQEEEKIN
jgi:hypothetical protein